VTSLDFRRRHACGPSRTRCWYTARAVRSPSPGFGEGRRDGGHAGGITTFGAHRWGTGHRPRRREHRLPSFEGGADLRRVLRRLSAPGHARQVRVPDDAHLQPALQPPRTRPRAGALPDQTPHHAGHPHDTQAATSTHDPAGLPARPRIHPARPELAPAQRRRRPASCAGARRGGAGRM
jgi:hypothetical protein